MARPGVTAIILHPTVAADADPLVAAVGSARARLAEVHRAAFLAVGAERAAVIAGAPDGLSFGARLRSIAADLPVGGGLVVLGSGAVPLAAPRDRARFVEAARGGARSGGRAGGPGTRATAGGAGGRALANNRYSADIVAIPDARRVLADVPDLPTDNALPRWLADERGLAVDDQAANWRLAMDLDTALDLVLLGGRWAAALEPAEREQVETRIDRLHTVVADPRAELVVAGRTSPATLTWLTRVTASRTRALVEERGLRTSVPGQRPPASVLGLLLGREGPGSLGAHLARLGEAAVVDTRVLLAHRHGADQATWPSDADRFASDLLLHDRIADPWLRDLTRAAAESPIPVLLGAHSLVGPGLRLALRQRGTR